MKLAFPKRKTRLKMNEIGHFKNEHKKLTIRSPKKSKDTFIAKEVLLVTKKFSVLELILTT